MSDTTGRTQGAGYEIGVSKTVPYPVADVWELITSPKGSPCGSARAPT